MPDKACCNICIDVFDMAKIGKWLVYSFFLFCTVWLCYIMFIAVKQGCRYHMFLKTPFFQHVSLCSGWNMVNRCDWCKDIKYVKYFCVLFSGDVESGKWLGAHYDPVASLYTFTQCVTLADISADGDNKLIIADLGTGSYDMKLKVYKGKD